MRATVIEFDEATKGTQARAAAVNGKCYVALKPCGVEKGGGGGGGGGAGVWLKCGPKRTAAVDGHYIGKPEHCADCIHEGYRKSARENKRGHSFKVHVLNLLLGECTVQNKNRKITLRVPQQLQRDGCLLALGHSNSP
jgi:hypothetical protein